LGCSRRIRVSRRFIQGLRGGGIAREGTPGRRLPLERFDEPYLPRGRTPRRDGHFRYLAGVCCRGATCLLPPVGREPARTDERAIMSQRAREIGFLDRFFGQPANEIALHSLRPELRAWLQPWIDDLEGPTDQPVVLPRRRNGRLQWFAMAFSDRQARALRDDLGAFVGPCYPDFAGQLAPLDPPHRGE